MCSQTRNSCAKAFDNRSRSKNLKSKKSRGGGNLTPPPPPSRLLGLIKCGWIEYNVIKFADPALPYSLFVLAFTAHLIYNYLFHCDWTDSMDIILFHLWKCLPTVHARRMESKFSSFFFLKYTQPYIWYRTGSLFNLRHLQAHAKSLEYLVRELLFDDEAALVYTYRKCPAVRSIMLRTGSPALRSWNQLEEDRSRGSSSARPQGNVPPTPHCNWRDRTEGSPAVHLPRVHHLLRRKNWQRGR